MWSEQFKRGINRDLMQRIMHFALNFLFFPTEPEAACLKKFT